jgi:hypothetical protein
VIICPSPALREREGPIAKRWEGEGGAQRRSLSDTSLRSALTRPSATLSRNAGEGFVGQCTAIRTRVAALATAFNEAVTMFSSMPTP